MRGEGKVIHLIPEKVETQRVYLRYESMGTGNLTRTLKKKKTRVLQFGRVSEEKFLSSLFMIRKDNCKNISKHRWFALI